MREPPDGWGQDRLSNFTDSIYQNCWASFVNLPNEFAWLKEVDKCFALVESVPKDSPLLEAFLFTRSQAAFRSAASLAMAGLAAESFCLNRSCIESALYGLHIHEKPRAAEIWLTRHKSKSTESKCRDEFSYGRVMHTLAQKLPQLTNIGRELYQRAVDFGAHPNERAISSALTMRKEPEVIEFTLEYMTGNERTLKHAIKTSAQAGTFALLVNGEIFKSHYQAVHVHEHLQHLCSIL